MSRHPPARADVVAGGGHATDGATDGTTDAIGRSDAPVAFESCTIGDGRSRAVAECATLAVPLDHDAPDGETLELAIARVRARRGGGDGAAFTLLAGGPGQSAIDSWAALSFAFRHVARDHDVVLVDQRGTGASHRLDCPETDPLVGGEGGAGIDASPAEAARAARACLAGLDVDPRLFTTSVAVRDLELVRERLGLPAWHLYGISYGTRVAQHYARRHADRVRTMTLDAVVPPDVPLGPDIAPLADRALGLLFARCAGDEDCASRFPDIAERTRGWIETLRAEPLRVTHEDLASGGTRETRFGATELAATLRLMSYDARTAALLPSMLHAAIEDGHVAPLARQVALQGTALGDSLASGMHHAVVCTEDAPRIPSDAAERAAGTLLGPALVDALDASCRDWPAGVLDPDFHAPLGVDVPTLILSGEADPITPPAYGERVAASLPRARHVVLADQGHMQAPLGCVPSILARFVASADRDADDRSADGMPPLDTDCLARIASPPFFVDANGPTP